MPKADRTKTSKLSHTMSMGFTQSLSGLMRKMNVCEPHFVRCIKPNLQKKPVIWDSDLVRRQLAYSGVLETITIRKMGYSVRYTYEEFVQLFRIIAFKHNQDAPLTKESCIKILHAAKIEDFAPGKTMIFLKYAWVFDHSST